MMSRTSLPMLTLYQNPHAQSQIKLLKITMSRTINICYLMNMYSSSLEYYKAIIKLPLFEKILLPINSPLSSILRLQLMSLLSATHSSMVLKSTQLTKSMTSDSPLPTSTLSNKLSPSYNQMASIFAQSTKVYNGTNIIEYSKTIKVYATSYINKLDSKIGKYLVSIKLSKQVCTNF